MLCIHMYTHTHRDSDECKLNRLHVILMLSYFRYDCLSGRQHSHAAAAAAAASTADVALSVSAVRYEVMKLLRSLTTIPTYCYQVGTTKVSMRYSHDDTSFTLPLCMVCAP